MITDTLRCHATAVFAERKRTFNPKLAIRLAASRREGAVELLDRIERHLSDGREVMFPTDYSAADVVWTVFLARMLFVGMGSEIDRRPVLTRYWNAMTARTSFAASDIWTSLQIGRLIRSITLSQA